MSLRRKILKGALILSGVAIFGGGMWLTIKMADEMWAKRQQAEQFLKTSGYDEVNASLKSDKILMLTNEFKENGGDPVEYANKVIEINNQPDLSYSEYLDKYATAQVREEYTTLMNDADKISPRVIVGAIGTSVGTTIPISFGIMPSYKKESKDENECEKA